MNKLFVKFIEDETLFEEVKEFVLELDRPKFRDGMSFQDYGAMCVAYDEMKKRVSERFDDIWREGEESKKNMV